MIGITIFGIATIAVLWLAHVRRSLAERAVDLLYHTAAVAYAVAQAADGALCHYRAARRNWHSQHSAIYASQAKGHA